jgi:hypothetical protein
MRSDGHTLAGLIWKTCLLALLICGASGAGSAAQTLGNITYRFRLSTAAATAGSLPFWLHADQYGVVDPASANTIGELSVYSPFDAQKAFSLSWGLDGVARLSDNSSAYLSEIYLKLKYSWLQLNAGRFKEQLGVYGGDLSSGSFIWSGNSTPMYKVCVFLNDYVDVPLTGGFVGIKGYFGHGWFGNNRYVRDAYLHQKSVFVKLGGRHRLNVVAGLLHNAMWGGYSQTIGELPSGLDDFWSVFMGEGGDADAPPGEAANTLGNHLGVWELGMTVGFERFDLLLHKTTPFEDMSGLKARSPEDGLYGVSIARKERGRAIDGLLWEFLYTKSQSGPDAPDDPSGSGVGRDNYFNNEIYRDGWTYDGRIIGTPLFAFDPYRTFDVIFNNRVVAHHFGIEGTVFSTRYMCLYTYSLNYGTYNDLFNARDAGVAYRFDPPLQQHAFLVRWERPFSALGRIFYIDAAVAGDVGELRRDNLGMMVGVKFLGMLGL